MEEEDEEEVRTFAAWLGEIRRSCSCRCSQLCAFHLGGWCWPSSSIGAPTSSAASKEARTLNCLASADSMTSAGSSVTRLSTRCRASQAQLPL